MVSPAPKAVTSVIPTITPSGSDAPDTSGHEAVVVTRSTDREIFGIIEV